MTKLLPGDRVSFEQNGRRLRGVVADGLCLRTRGEKLQVPVVRPRNVRRPRVSADGDHRPIERKVRWIDRAKLRKLPSP